MMKFMGNSFLERKIFTLSNLFSMNFLLGAKSELTTFDFKEFFFVHIKNSSFNSEIDTEMKIISKVFPSPHLHSQQGYEIYIGNQLTASPHPSNPCPVISKNSSSLNNWRTRS